MTSTTSIKRKNSSSSDADAAFTMYLQKRQDEIHVVFAKNGVSQTTIDMSSMIAEEWNDLPACERRMWQDKAATTSRPKKKSKTRREQGAPKRPMSAYFDFANSRRAAVKQQHIHASNGEISKILAGMWKTAPSSIKKPYTDRESENWVRYKLETEAWQMRLLTAPPSPSETVVSKDTLSGLDALATACQRRTPSPEPVNSMSDATITMPKQEEQQEQHKQQEQQSLPAFPALPPLLSGLVDQPQATVTPSFPVVDPQVQASLASMLLLPQILQPNPFLQLYLAQQLLQQQQQPKDPPPLSALFKAYQDAAQSS